MDHFTPSQFYAVFPEFVNVAANFNINQIHEFAAAPLDPMVFGADYTNAVMLLTAHAIKMSLTQGDGPLSSDRVGEVSQSYMNRVISTALDLTTYGMQYHSILRRKTSGGHFGGQSFPRNLGGYGGGRRYW